MPDKRSNLFIKLIQYLYVLSGLILFSCSVSAQETEEQPVFEEQDQTEQVALPESTQSDETSANAESSATPEADEDQAISNEDVSENDDRAIQNRDFDVFQPSEEISEDLAVPFPADI